MKCPLCKFTSPTPLIEVKGKRYLHCPTCDLRFMDKNCYIDRTSEVDHYLKHNNDPLDLGYQKYVEPLFEEIRKRLSPGAEGLDYGCGEGPVVTYLLERLGYKVALYDPVFQPGKDVLNRTYDFIIVSETAEHFHFPDEEFSRLQQLLRPGGFLGIMTKIYDQGIDFENWYYRRDPTHVCFYSQKTFKWIASSYNFKSPEFSSDRVAILTKDEQSI